MTSNGYMYSYSETVLFDKLFIGNNEVVNLYPVFMPVARHTVHIEATNGKFTYAVANDETLKTGYMADLAVTEGSSDYNSQEVQLYFYNVLTVTADQPSNEYFKFGSIESTIVSLLIVPIVDSIEPNLKYSLLG